MKSVSTLFRSIALTAIALIVVSGSVSSQEVTETRGTMGLTEGRQYMVAFPQVWASTTEKPLPTPMVLFISSRTKTKVRIQTPSAINSAARIDREVTVEADEVLQFKIDLPYMNEESETREGKGIQVTADRPISVSTFQAWNGNGELARHLPVEAWGRNYYSMNFYQDRYGSGVPYKYRPGQILIIAAQDNTVINYTPTVDTEGGREITSVRKGSTGTVELQKGETFLIKAKIDEAFNKEWSTDLSGTWIRGSRPFGVISGHTKVGILRYPDVLPPIGMFSAEAHFVRNNVHDAMLPVEMGGTEFVTVPAMYTSTRVTGAISEELGIDNDMGDVIRFVALEDNTTIQVMREQGEGFKNIVNLDRGETYVEPQVEVASMWRSDKPMTVGHYGKSFAKILPPAVQKGDGTPQGHPTVESGMPMLQYVPSVDRWVNYGVFHSPEGMDNFMNITFRPEDVGKIKIDGKALNSAFGGSMRELKGTPFYYIRTSIGVGDHVIESETEDVKWMAWTYGSLDGLAMGRAYGTPISVDLSIPCDDSLDVSEVLICGNVEGQGKILPEDSECGSIFGVYAQSLENYELEVDENFSSGDKKVNFIVRVLDPTKDANGTVRVVSRSGKFVEKTYTYVADRVEFSPQSLDFGTIPFSTTVCKEITFTNMRDDKPLTVSDLVAERFPGTFTFSPTNFSIPPGGSQVIEVCATITEPSLKIDTVIAELECFPLRATELRVRGAEPKIYVSDHDWGQVSVNSAPRQARKPLRLINGGNVDVIITDYDRSVLENDPTSNFTDLVGIDEFLPITLKAGEEHEFNVTYNHRGQANVQHRLVVPFYTNASKEDTVSILTGMAIEANLEALATPWEERVIDNVQTDQGINSYTQRIEITNSGTQGAIITSASITGIDAGSFTIVDYGNTGGFPKEIEPNREPSYYITVAFTPTELPARGAERDNYEAVIEFMNAENPLTAVLEGIAWQPQVKGAGHDYGTFNVGESAITMDLPITNAHWQDESNPTSGDAAGTHGVVVTDIRFVGGANNFEILNAPTKGNPWRIAGGDVELLQVRFDPRQAGNFNAQFEIITQPLDMTDGAAPYTPVYDLTANVLGGFAVEGDSADQYVLNTTELEIEITHPYTQVTRFALSDAKGPDASRFTVDPSLNGFIDVAPGETGIVKVAFLPDFVTVLRNGQDPALLTGKGSVQGLTYRANYFFATVEITDEFSDNVETATISGNGLYLETTNFVRDDYEVNVGEAVDVAIELAEVPESINPAQLTGLRTRIAFDNNIIKPRINIEDIVLDGTQAEGWTVLKVDPVSEHSIEIDIADERANKTGLTNNGRPIFKVTFDSYLGTSKDPSNPFTSPIDIYSYPVDHLNEWPVGTSKNFALIRDVPGQVIVNQDCAKGLRLVSVSSTNFGVEPVSPNPVSTTGVINYSIGISGNTTIVLYNQMGERIMDIVNANQSSGEYELTFDATGLPSGTYYYRVVSGPYISDPQVITVVH